MSILGEPERSKAANQINSRGLSYYVSADTPIVRWELHCAACWDEEGETICAIRDQRWIPSEWNNKSYEGVYVMQRDANGYMQITDRPLTYRSRGRQVARRIRKEDPVCDIYKGP